MAAPLVHWPQGAPANVEMFWRWLHIVSAILWIGLLYFFNLVSTQFAAQLDPALRPRVLPGLMWRALNWFRWGSLVTVLSGLAYLGMIVTADARNGGGARQGGYWGSWFAIWIAVWAIFYLLLRFGNKTLVYTGTAVVIILASWLFLRLNAHGWESNRALSTGIGGGMGFFLLLNVWGIVWRAQKKILRWMEATTTGSTMPIEAAKLASQAALTSRFSFYLTFVIIFFMAAASHFPLFGV